MHHTGSPQHNIGPLVFAAASVHSHEDSHGQHGGTEHITTPTGRFGLDGQREEMCLAGEKGLITSPVFIKSCHYGITVYGYKPIEPLLCCSEPITTFLERIGIGAQFIPYVEITIA